MQCDPAAPRLLAPCDLQAIKAAGVTFVASMLERVIEIKSKRLGPNNVGTADAVARLGLYYIDRHQPARALVLFERSARSPETRQCRWSAPA